MKEGSKLSSGYSVAAIIYISASIALFLCCFICIFYWLCAAHTLGWLPTYDHPDPKALGWPVFHALVGIAILFIILLFPLLLAAFIAVLFAKRKQLHPALIIAGLIPAGLALFVWMSPFLEWYVD
jgi:hypothetical protein